MNISEQAIVYAEEPARDRGWIRNGAYDWFFIIGSALVIVLVIGFFAAIRPDSTNLLNQGNLTQLILLGIPLLLGGPHIFFSFIRVFRDPEFRMRFPRMVTIAPHAIGGLVIYLIFLDATQGYLIGKGPGTMILVNLIFFSAVVHGLSQLVHVALKYRKNLGEPMTWRGYFIDATLIFCGPLGYILHSVRAREFVFVGHRITPAFSVDVLIYGMGGLFALAALGYVAEAAWLWRRRGIFNWKRFVIIVTANAAFVVLAEVREADISFQAYNAWHSIQAMGIMWAAANAKVRRGGKLLGGAAKLCAEGKFLLCYVYGVVFALAIGTAVVVLSGGMADLEVSPWYFVIAVSVLLIHHYFDYFLFFHRKAFDY